MKNLLVLSLSVFFSACASTGTQGDALATLCAQSDLTSVNQRVSLAGGYEALAKNNLACAERLSLDAKTKDPKDAYAWLNLGAVYQRTQRLELAREHYTKAMQLDGGVPADQAAAHKAHLSTREASRGNRPAEIAQFNLGLMNK